VSSQHAPGILHAWSFSPSIYAQEECFLMRRNCSCNCMLGVQSKLLTTLIRAHSQKECNKHQPSKHTDRRTSAMKPTSRKAYLFRHRASDGASRYGVCISVLVVWGTNNYCSGTTFAISRIHRSHIRLETINEPFVYLLWIYCVFYGISNQIGFKPDATKLIIDQSVLTHKKECAMSNPQRQHSWNR
jgi:hypothetical protein